MQRREINHVKFDQPEPTVINIWVYLSSWTLPIYTFLLNVCVGLINTVPDLNLDDCLLTASTVWLAAIVRMLSKPKL